ncbi:QacE family quaternary ammonium compound efflux SMR transporter [Pseudomonas fluvialis]|uniref:Guanidinium exporter n=1 Tax=Pseudomonas fluvialis TaxID=1793966 RepID=A0A2I0CN68_9PSED|nr:multidrug efflux SMR transporter [Pseudomonas pharmacofabricae]PKF70591.1 QacE family quaternary ammonium compound efflux SMR transporter [Pseudomonas pharmacofabricae]
MSWWIVLCAGLFEVAWVVGLKYSAGFTRPWPSLATLLALLVSLWLLSLALRHLPLGTAYAVWVGIGVLGSALLGVLLFGETLTPLRLFSLGLIIAGVVGLKMAG